MLSKKLNELTLEDKQKVVVACYIVDVVISCSNDDYSFLTDIITGDGITHISLDYPDVVLSEFDELIRTEIGDKEVTLEEAIEYSQIEAERIKKLLS